MQKNLDDVYPTSEEVKEFDLLDEINEMVNKKIESFNQAKIKTVSLTAFIEQELKVVEDVRNHRRYDLLFDVGFLFYPGTLIQPTFDDIYIIPFFNIGWEMAVNGNFIVKNDIYKRYPFLIKQIVDVFHSDQFDPKSDKFDPFGEDKRFNKEPPHIGYLAYYFEGLSDEVIFLIKQGMASAKYYYWLKELENDKENLATNKLTFTSFKSNLTDQQIENLFNQLKTNGFISPDTKEYNFLHVFGEPLPDKEGFEPVKWIKKGKNKEVNKASLIELCVLLNEKTIPDTRFFKQANYYFATDKENNIILKHNNISKSQYYSILKKIVESL